MTKPKKKKKVKLITWAWKQDGNIFQETLHRNKFGCRSQAKFLLGFRYNVKSHPVKVEIREL